nr:platelet-activating factor receptor isoform X2 [Paramormyrops kingsleyae]XP_023688755.1 platelet-activating factor receptor isoform X2 [Paramormyrops kingsleyae]XP_023688756.1 platelet-activating factor receptor isoform X2 [Paramormyrops kingsleyae]XP_023688757.1 platelet-activating factor receptor isoform X2 [Paramormyrops kingsleyae]XP_023688758.1 platelet-activating factor receptor isoform X2 [Paramormyrops kingsleyae]
MMSSENMSQNDSFLDSQFRYSVFPTFYSLVFIFGLIANCYALYILRNIRDVKAVNEVRIYMTNLTVADLLFIIILPLWIDYYNQWGNWRFHEAMCRVSGAMFYINTYCSILFLAVISFNRYWVVTRPLSAATSDHWHRGVLVSLVIWLFSVSASIPYLFQKAINDDKVSGKSRCFEGYHNMDDRTKHSLVLTHFLIIAFFFVVFLLVVICNLLIVRALLVPPVSPHGTRVSVRSLGLKCRALGMVMVVLVVFVVCFVPYHLVQGPWTLAVLQLAMVGDRDSRQLLNDAHQVTLMLMGLNCLLDPVIYCLATKMFRSYISMHFKKVMRGRSCPRNSSQTTVSMETRAPKEVMGPTVH